MGDSVLNHFGNWGGVLVFFILYSIMIFFVPFYKKSQRKPTSVYIAFVLAYVLEMFGIPFSMYIIAWFFGFTLPDGILWGHTLNQYIGHFGMYIGILITIIGISLVVIGWKNIYDNYWSKEKGKGKLVTSGIYAYIRHPQYTGFFLVTLGMILEWATLTLLLMWPTLIILYYRLAKKEEEDMLKEFGEDYKEYKKRTSMFLPI
ncbi:MAG: isoprenylcysteine carboxylmethyltransferase family protein [Firmicutes bacterium]|nr:isoprenylcysteine carboxylmethyltransferase family protein [Bacillota bacterium]